MAAEIRLAQQSDVSALFDVRTSVRENHISFERLAKMGVTETSISEMIAASHCAWVATIGGKVVGFSMIDISDASLFAAFILPSHEDKGLGKKLVLAAEEELFKHHAEIWLETDRDSRAAGFYRHLGWGGEREAEGGQIRFTKIRP
ncbi:GNAT family N-acetyltransferase [Agrobacterium vaccinii]|nr:GNAT family N-acetyltransferase [Agrobacterium vaccinii]